MDLEINQQQLSSVVVLLMIIKKSATSQQKTRKSTKTSKTTTTTTTRTTTTRKTTANISERTQTMGACMGRCLTNEKQNSCLRSSRRHSTDEQEIELMPDEDKRKKEKLIFRIIKFKRKEKKKQQFIEKFWETQESNCSELNRANDEDSEIQLQNLDVQTLLITAIATKESTISFNTTAAGIANNSFAVTSSRASSSLDLEWEHEYGKFSTMSNIKKDPNPTTESWRFLSQSTINDEDDDDNDDDDDDDDDDADSDAEGNHLLDGAVEKLHSLPSPPSCVKKSSDEKSQLPPPPNPSPNQRINNFSKVLEKSASTAIPRGTGFVANYNGGGNNFPRTSSSNNSWSHISTPESLEWDIDEDQQNQMRVEDDNLDHETLELLHQIEMLKNQVLHETGDGILDGGLKQFRFEGIANSDS